MIDKTEHTCTPSPELIGVIIGGSLGNYIRVYGGSNTWFVIDKEKYTCTPSPELIGVIIGGSLGNYKKSIWG